MFDVRVLAGRNALTPPVEFLEPETVYELKRLALEAGGNQTVTVGTFVT